MSRGRAILFRAVPICVALGVVLAAPCPAAFGKTPGTRKHKKGVYHRVVPGESLYSISRAYKVKTKAIFKANGLKKHSEIHPGMRLFIPRARKVVRAYDAAILRDLALQEPGISFLWPLKGLVTSEFGERGKGFHTGVDIATRGGIIIVSAAAGTVVSAGMENRSGLTLVIEHENGYSTMYGHLSRVFVAEGQAVREGQAVGAVGETGNATGFHLHFEIRRDQIPLDPLLLLPRPCEEVPGTAQASAQP
jgi:murein DD-endopeptidase MepM/ murein hydrolase activator NlpD